MKLILTLLVCAGLAVAQTPAKDAKKPTPPAKPAAPAKVEPAKPAAQPTAPKPVSGGFLGNKDSKLYHKADCKAAAKIKEANRVAFASKEEAEKQGYKACKVCLK